MIPHVIPYCSDSKKRDDVLWMEQSFNKIHTLVTLPFPFLRRQVLGYFIFYFPFPFPTTLTFSFFFFWITFSLLTYFYFYWHLESHCHPHESLPWPADPIAHLGPPIPKTWKPPLKNNVWVWELTRTGNFHILLGLMLSLFIFHLSKLKPQNLLFLMNL